MQAQGAPLPLASVAAGGAEPAGFTLVVPALRALGGSLRAGDRVTVLATFESGTVAQARAIARGLRVLTVGSTLTIPIFNEGALFFTGDPHGVQGDGEVDGGALEQSLTATLQFILHKGMGKNMRGPRAEDANNYYALGLDLDLNMAMKTAVRETVELLQERAGLTAAEAYSVASLGVDFKVAEAVDSVQLIYGTIPKKFFKQNPPYWTSR